MNSKKTWKLSSSYENCIRFYLYNCTAEGWEINHSKRLFNRVLIPEEVYKQIYVDGKDGFVEFKKANFFEMKKTKDKRFFDLSRDLVDDSKAASIILVLQEDADLIILDDKDARKIAEKLGLKVTRTAGILLLAKKKIAREIKSILENQNERVLSE